MTQENPRLESTKQEVVAQQCGMLFFISTEHLEKLLQ